MNEELKIKKEDLVNWIDRPPSNDDLDLCEYLSNAVQNQEKYFEKNKQLQNNWNELKKWVKEYEENSYGLGSYETGIADGLGDVLKKMQELEGNNE